MGASRAMDANLQGVFIALIVIAFVFAIDGRALPAIALRTMQRVGPMREAGQCQLTTSVTSRHKRDGASPTSLLAPSLPKNLSTPSVLLRGIFHKMCGPLRRLLTSAGYAAALRIRLD
jgi:hypothetical protein